MDNRIITAIFSLPDVASLKHRVREQGEDSKLEQKDCYAVECFSDWII
jgi:hypothetical protein